MSRAATTASRLTASASSPVSRTAVAANSAGIIRAMLGYSPAVSRVVMVRAPKANPATAGAPSVPVSTCTRTGSSPVSLATSARAGAGIRTGGGSQAPAGCQGSSRSAARYRSVATMVIASAVKVTWMAHRAGSVSSRDAATTTCRTAAASSAASACPAGAASSGSAG